MHQRHLIRYAALTKYTLDFNKYHKHTLVTTGFRSRAKALTCTKQDVTCCGVPRNDANPFGVALQHHHRLRHGSDQAIVRDLPHLLRI